MHRITQKEHIDPVSLSNPNIISSIRYSTPLHCHDYYEFFLITRGRCLHKVNGGAQHLSEGALVFIRPDDCHCYDCDGAEDCSFLNLACARSAVEDALRYLGNGLPARRLLSEPMPPFVMLNRAEREDFIADFDRLRVLTTIDRVRAGLELRRMLADILTSCFAQSDGGARDALPLWFESLLTQMQRRDNFTAGLPRLYALSHRSAGYLCRAFRRYTGKTPTEYVNSLRLGYARSLLIITEQSVTDIALEAGFDNLSHFYHLFRAQYDVAPALLRRRRG